MKDGISTGTVPTKPDGLAEALRARIDLQTDPEAFRAFIHEYTSQALKGDPELKAQMEESQRRVTRQVLEEAGMTLRDLRITASGKRPPMSPGKPGDGAGAALDGKYKRFGEFLTEVRRWTGQEGSSDFPREKLRVLGEGQGDQGGFLVPEEYRATLLELAVEEAVVRPRATVIPMGRETVRIPSVRDTTHATTVFGGIRAYWVPESGAVTASEPTFSQVRLDAKKLTGYTTASNELLADSAISLEAVLQALFSRALAYFEDEGFINGVGGGQPLGILNADALVSVAKETGQAAATIVWENIVKMFSRMYPASLGRAIWVVNPSAFPQLATMSLAVGTGGAPVWLGNGAGDRPATILGRPVLYSEKCQALGTAGDIYFVDLSYYLIGDRQALTVASSPHVRFTNDETVWRFVQRVDGRPWVDSALTPRYGTTTLSPFVALATRS